MAMGLFRRILDWVEKRATLKDSEGWLYDYFTGGRSSAAGIAVSPHIALTLSSYYACVRAIAEDLGKIPLILYRRRPDGGKERATQHPLYRILRLAPNRNMSAMDFRSGLVAYGVNWGNGYSEIVRGSNGQVTELWPLASSNMRIDYDGNRLVYIYRDSKTGTETLYEQWQIFHLRGLASDGIQGYSLARLARESIGLALAQERSGAAFFGNAARPSGVLEAAPGMKTEQRLEMAKEWNAVYGGVANAHKTAVLSGLTFKPLTVANEDAQWIESRHLSIEEMARWLRCPPHKIAHLLRATYDNIEHQSLEYVTDCLMSWAVRIEQEISRKLIVRRDQSTLFAEHLFDSLLRGDIKTRFEAYGSARQWGHLTINEVRAKENLNPIGQAGDVHMVPANMMNAERLLQVEVPNNGMDLSSGNQGNRPPDEESPPESEAQTEGKRSLGVGARCIGRRYACRSATGGNGNGKCNTNNCAGDAR